MPLGIPRAVAEHIEGAKIKFTWPCGHFRIITQMIGPRGHRRPMNDFAAKFYSKYWGPGHGVNAGLCPTCHPDAPKSKRFKGS